MWKKSFVATTVSLGGSVDEAVQALFGVSPDLAHAEATHLHAETRDLIEQLRAPQRTTRKAVLVAAVRDIVLAIDESTLR